MRSPSLETAVRRIRTLTAPLPDGLSDRDLLKRFLTTRDESAFAALVARHGPAVLGVCRRILSDRHAAEDAFQATFLVLARRASAIRKTASVGCWLHGVAIRVASKLKARLARQPRAARLPDVPADPRDDVSWRDVRRVLDEEVHRLPDRLRLPVWFCYFEGKTRDEAAEVLGWKLTTLRGRLEDGRQRLRSRLALRGIELSAALLAVSTADALALDERLLQSAVRAATGSTPEIVQSLAKGIATSGVVGKVKLSAGALILALGLGSTMLMYRGEAGETPGPGPMAKAPEAPAKSVEPPPAKPLAKDDGWGDAAGDFRLRLHKPAGALRVGDLPELVCDLKFTGKEKRSVFALPENAAIELDRRWYHSHRQGSFAGKTTELSPGSVQSDWLRVRPDSEWIHLRDKPDADDLVIREAVPYRLSAGTHTLRVAYSLSKDERAISNAVTIEIASDGWGEPNGGVKSRIRLARTKYKPGEPLEFELDLKNLGRKSWNVAATPSNCQLYLDDRMFALRDELDDKAPMVELKPGSELVPFLKLRVDTDWVSFDVRPGRPFRLAPGKHRVRFDYTWDSGRLPSNTAEIEVVAPPLDSAVQALALNADRVWVVPSPTRDQPVPLTAQVLKGPPADRPSVADLGSLPSVDPKKRWIVFLQADEVRRGVPEIHRVTATPWYVPYDESIVAAISEVSWPVDWGPERDGLRMGLRLRDMRVPGGNPVIAELAIHNAGNSDQTIQQHRLNIYDYWPGTRFEVSAPNGSKWVLYKPAGPIDELDALKDVKLKPGESYVHAIRLDRWFAHRDPTDGDASLPNLFTKPGKYMITCRVAKSPVVGEAGWQAGLVSSPVPLMVTIAEPKPGDWGAPTDGLRARVRLPKGPIAAGGPLEFDFDLKNVGDKVREIPAHGVLCDLDLDGVRYAYPEKYDIKGNKRKLEPGEELAPLVTVAAEMWQRTPAKRGEPAGIAHALTPGKHKLVASFRLDDKTRVIAPAVEFEVKADEWGESSGGIKARLRLAKATFRAGEPLAFELDLKNTGDKTYEDGPVPFHCRIELDGAEYQYTAPLSYPTSIQKLTPGKEFIPYVKVTTDEWWIHSRAKAGGEIEALPLKLMPGKHKVRVSYPMIGKEKLVPVTPVVEFEVADDAAALPDLPTLVAASDRIVFAKIDWKDGKPRVKLTSTRLGPNNRWQPDVQPISIPVGAEQLPADTGGSDWILFLKAEEDGVDVPKLSPASAKGWFRPVTSENARDVELAIMYRNARAATDGRAVADYSTGESKPYSDGMTLRLQPAANLVHVGEEICLDVALTNRAKEQVRVLQQRYNVYDYWPFLTFTVTRPGGSTVTLVKSEGPFTREDFIDEFALVDGQSYTHVVRLDRWRAIGPKVPREIVLQSPFRQPGVYKVQATYKAPAGFKNINPQLEFKAWPFWSGELKSNVVTIEVRPETVGKEVQGVRARMRSDKAKWKTGESPRLEFDLTNAGKQTWAGAPSDRGCLLEVDGVWYENDTGKAGPKAGSEMILKPRAGWAKWFDVFADRPRGGATAWIRLTPDDKPSPIPEAWKLKLTPGKHTVRVAYLLTEYGDNGQRLKGDAAEIRVESNAIEIEIEP